MQTQSRDRARSIAREKRRELGDDSRGLLAALREEFAREGFAVVAVAKDFLQGSRGELAPDERTVYYDSSLNEREVLEVLAHEFGHWVLHHRHLSSPREDLLRGSVFLGNGSAGLSRYSPRSQEEADANAFAAELICPARDIFDLWKRSPDIASVDLQDHFAATRSLVRIQLAEGLYEHISGSPPAASTDTHPPTQEQERAATLLGVPVLVDAGPGTGKTKTLVRRVAYLVEDLGVDPENILILTFSNEAAEELRTRLAVVLGEERAARIVASTFHGFGVFLLNLLGEHEQLDVDYTIIDDTAQEELVEELLGNVACDALVNIKDPSESAAEIARAIGFLKDRLVDPTAFAAEVEGWNPPPDQLDDKARAEALYRIYVAYEDIKRTRQCVDFADLIQKPFELLAGNPELRRLVREQFPHVLVDEYQDVSRATALFLREIAGAENPPWVVGDPRQAIYRFRGADPENVRRFSEDFPAAETRFLSENFRSAVPIIDSANQLASLLDETDAAGLQSNQWVAGSSIDHVGDEPVRTAIAPSDAAERDGVSDCVQEWLAQGIEPHEIAVLARRNIDVRNIVIELKRRGIRAVTTGIVTAEGAGGDLAGTLSAVDHDAALPRLVYALHSRSYNEEDLNAAIRQMLTPEADGSERAWKGEPSVREIAGSSSATLNALREIRFSADAWGTLTEFLFFASTYLRQYLPHVHTDAEAAVQVEEVVSVLALAAGYRLSHRGEQPRSSRLGFAERLRRIVTHPQPGSMRPRAREGAVRVMTCHASKGLEFGCVLVAGQTLPDMPRRKEMLPPGLRPDASIDERQSDSLLFVGVTRAQKAVVISAAESASGSPQGRRRRFTPLLAAWQKAGHVPTARWEPRIREKDEYSIGAIWGGTPPPMTSLYALGKNTCSVRTYLQDHLGLRFRGRFRPLYPEFMRRTRRMLKDLVQLATDTGRAVSAEEAEAIFAERWPEADWADHPHIGLYRDRARDWTVRLASALEPPPTGQAVGEPTDAEGEASVNLQLIGLFRDRRGDIIALTADVRAPNGKAELNWSDIPADYRKLPFVLLYERGVSLKPHIFFGEDGDIRALKWHRNKEKAIKEEALRASEVHRSLRDGLFAAKASEWACDRCDCRTVCPLWMGVPSE